MQSKTKDRKRSVYTTDPIIRLVENYDLSKTEIGMVYFESDGAENEDYYCFGQFEVERLCISKVSREIVMASDETVLEVLNCAKSS